MTRHFTKASLVVSLLLHASVSAASAECAWVLWAGGVTEPGRAESDEWKPVRAYSASEPCLKAAEERTERRYQTGEYVYHSFAICLPDTIDPRGPKAK